MFAQTPASAKFAVTLPPSVLADLRSATWFAVVLLPTVYTDSRPATLPAVITHFTNCDAFGTTWYLLHALGVASFFPGRPCTFAWCDTFVASRLGSGGVAWGILGISLSYSRRTCRSGGGKCTGNWGSGK